MSPSLRFDRSVENWGGQEVRPESNEVFSWARLFIRCYRTGAAAAALAMASQYKRDGYKEGADKWQRVAALCSRPDADKYLSKK